MQIILLFLGGQVRHQPATSEHLTPKDVVIMAGPAEANLALFLKGQSTPLRTITVMCSA